MSFNIWEGIYKDFSECPVSGDGHEGTTWVTKSIEKVNRQKVELKQGKPVTSDPESILPLLVAIQLHGSNAASILDFGGGLGSTYLSVISSLKCNVSISFHIVESGAIFEAGTSIFKDDGRITFYKYPDFPSKDLGFDIVHIGSSLQYIDAWKELLKQLAGYRPSYFLFEDLLAGNIPTFASIQNYYESKMPHWFFSLTEIINFMELLEYRLVFRSVFNGKYLGVRQKPPLDNFPPAYRIENTWNLLFVPE